MSVAGRKSESHYRQAKCRGFLLLLSSSDLGLELHRIQLCFFLMLLVPFGMEEVLLTLATHPQLLP